MYKLEIIDRIGYFRTRAKLSQKALSINIDMNIGYINRLECKKDFLPSLEVLLVLFIFFFIHFSICCICNFNSAINIFNYKK